MILTKTTKVKWDARTRKWYESRGYIYTNPGGEFEVKIKDLSKGSGIKILAQCEKCGKEKEMRYIVYLKIKNNGNIYVCPSCSYFKNKQTCLKNHGVENPSQSEEIKKKKKETTLKNYGVENPNQSKKVQERTKKTNLKRYGVENPFQSEEVKEKIKETNLERYGVENAAQSEEVKEKMKKTNLKRYGVEYPQKLQKFKNKIKETNLERYGVKHGLQSKEIRDKGKKTNLERYGAENPFASEEIKGKIKKTCFERYGVYFACQSEEVKEKIFNTMIERYGEAYLYFIPKYNPNTIQFIDDLSEITGIHFRHAINHKKGEKKFHKYWVDAYNKDYNIVLEFDEKHHNPQKEKDEERQQYIEDNFNCKFIRIDWEQFINNPEEEFELLVEQIELLKS